MKKIFFLLSVIIILVLSGCSFIGGLLLNDEEKEFIGLWRSGGWGDAEDSCYYDFRDNGRVFVTDWTNDLQTTNNLIVPNYLNYSVNKNVLKMSQNLGFVKFEFGLSRDLYSTIDAWYLDVENESFDYYELELGTQLYMYRLADYSDEARALRSFLEGFDYE